MSSAISRHPRARRSYFSGRIIISVCFLVLGAIAAAATADPRIDYAQSAGPQGDEFNNTVFAAPFFLACGHNPSPQTCPDSQQIGTWSLDSQQPGALRIWTQPGSLLGGVSNARNLVLQSIVPTADYVATTKMAFPGVLTGSIHQIGQTAGLIVYQDDNNFVLVGRLYPTTSSATLLSQLVVIQVTNGNESIISIPEPNNSSFNTTVYLQLRKTGDVYQAFYGYDGTTFLPFVGALTPTSTPTSTPTGTLSPTPTGTPPLPTATATAVASSLVADYTTPKLGLFGWGGQDPSAGTNEFPADFDWFRVGNDMTPAPTALPTATNTPVTPTLTPTAPTATLTNTSVPATLTPTLVASPTNTATAIPTPTPRPTRTPRPKPKPKVRVSPSIRIHHVSVKYRVVHVDTYNRVDLQASQSGVYGIWVHVIFATGLRLDYYSVTDVHGHWTKTFPIPADSISAYGGQAVVTFQLFRGKHYAKSFVTFKVIR